jgi:hypothetical protein
MAVILGLVGFVWMLQGLGVIAGRGFMFGDPKWALIGAGVIVLAVAYALWPRFARR